MTEKAIEAMIDEAQRRFDIYAVRVIHRVGLLQPLDQIVMVAVTSAHRGESFKACEFLMDYLKTQAPFWKKEQHARGRPLGRCPGRRRRRAGALGHRKAEHLRRLERCHAGLDPASTSARQHGLRIKRNDDVTFPGGTKAARASSSQLAGQPLQQLDQLGLLRLVQRRQQALVGLFGGLLCLRQHGRPARGQRHRDTAFVARRRCACQQAPRLKAAQHAQHRHLVETERARQARLAETGVRPQHGEHAKLGGRQCQLAALVLENGGGNLVRAPQQETGTHIELRQAGWRLGRTRAATGFRECLDCAFRTASDNS